MPATFSLDGCAADTLFAQGADHAAAPLLSVPDPKVGWRDLSLGEGKNVAPAVLEDRLRAHPLVSQCLVVGDAKPFVACLITIDPEAWPDWAAERGKVGPAADHLEDPQLRAEVIDAIYR